MKNTSAEHEPQQPEESTRQQEHRTRHEAPNWARKYLDLADQAMTGHSSDDFNQR